MVDETTQSMKKAIEHLRHDLQKIRTGRAHPSLLDPNFRRSVVLLSEHSRDEGAIGVVLNRPLESTLGMLRPEQAQRLADAGLDYYNHNLDSSPEYYEQVITTRSYQDRQETLAHVRDAGINVEMVATDVGGWNQKLSEWDYDMAFTYLYQYGDPALGVARTYISSNIEKGSRGGFGVRDEKTRILRTAPVPSRTETGGRRRR